MWVFVFAVKNTVVLDVAKCGQNNPNTETKITSLA